ncbi:MAG: SDR family oxidoreductase, partial [Actinomycetota bacterium]|nr:SDR family oxidoreductase [Actinomycetota bacterium]
RRAWRRANAVGAMGEGTVLVTGGAGYVGALVAEELISAGRAVRVLDALLHGQDAVAERLRARCAEVVVGDVRDPEARRRALAGAWGVVHLAAIVGDPACARDPEGSRAVNLDASRSLLGEAAEAGVERLVFASTCSNYGRMADPTVALTEEAELRPVSRYAEQKVAVERLVLERAGDGVAGTCLRFATVYGAAPRMRFDLTVNEFTRDLWAGRTLEVFGERFWRPYVHVRDAARAVRSALDAPREAVAGAVFNVGRSSENYRKLDLVEAIRGEIRTGEVVYVHRDEDPRDYRVSFDKVAAVLGFETTMTVPDGVAEVAAALSEGRFGDPFDPRHHNCP